MTLYRSKTEYSVEEYVDDMTGDPMVRVTNAASNMVSDVLTPDAFDLRFELIPGS